MLPLLLDPEPRLVGIQRSDVGPHGGQFALPGGKVERDDADAWQSALREMREEVGLERSIECLGHLGEFNTHVSRFRVDVFVGLLSGPQRWVPEEREVAAVLELPLGSLLGRFRRMPAVEDVWELPIDCGFELDPVRYLVAGGVAPRGRGHRLGLGDSRRSMPFIWGLTARILYDFLRLVWIPATVEDPP